MRQPGTAMLIVVLLLAGACRSDRSQTTGDGAAAADCATADTTGLSMFVRDPFQRDLAIDTPTRIMEHLDQHPALICLRFESSHGSLPAIGYATAHRPDVAYIYPLLVERGADPADALPVAVYLGKTRALPWLLEHGVDPNSGDALVIAASEDRTRIVEQLLAAGADPNRRASVGPFVAEPGKTALHFAARHGRREMIEALISAGANVNTPDARRNPPLHEAVVKRDAATIRLLYDRGAVPSMLSPEDRDTLRELARRYGLDRLAAELG